MIERYFAVYRGLAAQVELLTSLAELEGLREEWWELWRRTPAATPFQTPAWLIAWTQSFAPPGLLTLAWRCGRRLEALLPLYVDEAGVARPLGVGVSDELDLLGDPRAAAPFLARLAGEGVVRLDLPDLAPGSALAQGAAGWSCESFPAEPRSALALPARLPARKRRKLNMARNRAARLGGCALERTGAEGLDWLFRLHAARWSSRGGQGVLAEARVQALHRAAAVDLDRAGLLRSYLLRIGGRPAGAFYGFCAHRRTYAYLSGMAPDLAYASPGSLVVAHAIEEAAREGAQWFDFLRGAEAYKQDWGAEARPGRTVVLRRRDSALAA
jgi:CelD/BcsL family acetyltransferase involved in cellulose biosynthesis